MTQSFVQFIDDRGGVTAMARATGYGAGAVALWRHRNKIPRGAWPEIVEAFPDVSLPKLKEIEAASGAAPVRSAFAETGT